VAPPFEVDLGSDTSFCPGTFYRLDAGFSGSGYLWSDGSSSQMIIVNTLGTFWVEVTDSNGCIDSDTIILSPPSPTGPVDTITWIGDVSDDWFDPCNWDKISVPDTSLHALIPGGTSFNPVVRTDTGWCKTINILHQNGGHVTYDFLSGGKLLKKP